MVESWKAFPLALLGLAMVFGFASEVVAQDKNKIPSALDRPLPETSDEPEPKEEQDERFMQFEMEPERWVEMAYGSLGGTRASFELSFRRRVRMTLNQIELLCGIADEVREKVTKTADLEFQRLEADITAIVSEAPRRPNQAQYEAFYNQLMERIAPFAPAMQFVPVAIDPNRKTVWEKVLQSNLSDEQREIVEEDKRKRTEYRHRVRRLTTLMRVSRVLGLSSKQMQDLERVADANPDGWTSLETAWNVLAAMPESQQKEYFTEAQRIRLTRPLEFTNDLQPVMMWEFNP